MQRERTARSSSRLACTAKFVSDFRGANALKNRPPCPPMPLGRECRAQAKLGGLSTAGTVNDAAIIKNRCVTSEAQSGALASKVAKAKAGVWSYSSELGD